ncbi:hypothetical protein FHW67_002086 [Herbaspirillum sp. Sphag1AN]|nr:MULTISPECIES: hypothetical protein [unclassified Herbaspirillum]MBB3212798.1 hypothetical protein [Herbaspirillum sp. Sphag1AN]MBB3245995.1 hypothetical protein [Herbaspirillum sp. Sphag64]
MLWLILEAGSAFFIFVFIVWWTMFSGKKPTQPAQRSKPDDQADDQSA